MTASLIPHIHPITGNLHPGSFTVIASRPGIGKTALALNFAIDLAQKNVGVSYHSGEANRLGIKKRLWHILTETPMGKSEYHEMEDGRLKVEGKVLPGEIYLPKKPEGYDDPREYFSEAITIGSAVSKVIFIDYIQLYAARDKPIFESMSEISHALKNLAMEHGIAIVALSQLGRSVEDRQGRRPLLQDLVGPLEQDADLVILLHRRDWYDPMDQPNTADLIIAKNRCGPVENIKLGFKKESNTFYRWQEEQLP